MAVYSLTGNASSPFHAEPAHHDLRGSALRRDAVKKLIAMLFCCASAFAQVETTTSITGTVTDQQGAVFAGAAVRLTNQNTGAVRETSTNADGVYSFQSLPAGTYTVSALAKGFKTTTITDRRVETAQPA